MPRKKLPEELDKKIAYLRSTGMRRADIANLLSVSPATVQRKIKEATKGDPRLLVEQNPELMLTPDEAATIHHSIYDHDRLIEALKKESETLKDVDIFRTQNFSDAAAGYLIESILPISSTIAVAWGGTIADIVDAIARQFPKSSVGKKGREIKFIQACGEPDKAVTTRRISSSRHVALLNKAINGGKENPYSFPMPAVMPAAIPLEGLEYVKMFIRKSGGYSEIFDDNQRLRVDATALITSCGTGRRDSDSWIPDCAASNDIEAKQLEELTRGNISGYWLPAPDIDGKRQEKLEEINDRWIGIKVDDIKRIAEREPGVVLTTTGEEKAAIVLHLVRSGMVSCLLIDDRLAAGLKKLLAIPPGGENMERR